MNTQEMINQLRSHEIARSEHKEFKQYRSTHNQTVQDLIDELSEDCDE